MPIIEIFTMVLLLRSGGNKSGMPKGMINLANKVLVVDDQFGIRMLLQEVFTQDGYRCRVAANGAEALELIRQDMPDLVLLDMKIPGMSGLEILQAIRRIPSDVEVFMMTAYGELDMIKEARRLGVETYFTKPFDIEKLRQAVHASLGRTTACSASTV